MGHPVAGLVALLLASGLARAQERPLVIPQAEGERQGAVIGRAMACGAPSERTNRVLQAGRARMQAIVGRALTDERYVLALNEALAFETSLPAPSAERCARALEALERLDTVQ